MDFNTGFGIRLFCFPVVQETFCLMPSFSDWLKVTLEELRGFDVKIFLTTPLFLWIWFSVYSALHGSDMISLCCVLFAFVSCTYDGPGGWGIRAVMSKTMEGK